MSNKARSCHNCANATVLFQARGVIEKRCNYDTRYIFKSYWLTTRAKDCKNSKAEDNG